MNFTLGQKVIQTDIFIKNCAASAKRTGSFCGHAREPQLVRVLLDGTKQATVWHESFWEPWDGKSAEQMTREQVALAKQQVKELLALTLYTAKLNAEVAKTATEKHTVRNALEACWPDLQVVAGMEQRRGIAYVRAEYLAELLAKLETLSNVADI